MTPNRIEALEILLTAEGIVAEMQSAIDRVAGTNVFNQTLMGSAGHHQASINEAEAMIASLSTPREE